MHRMRTSNFSAKKTILALVCSLPIVLVSGAANAATITNPTLVKVESGVNAFGNPSCNFTISFSVTGVNADLKSGDVWHLGVGSASSPQIHGLYRSTQPVGTTQAWNNVSLLNIDRLGAYTPQAYSIRFFETTSVIQTPPFPTVIAEIPIPQADLRAAGGVCLDAIVDRRSPRTGTVGN